MSTAASGTRMDTGEDIAAIETIRRGIALLPGADARGSAVTLLLAVVAAAGQVVVPDRGAADPRPRAQRRRRPRRPLHRADGARRRGRARGHRRRVVPHDRPAVHAPPSAAWPRCASRRSGTSTTCRCSPRTPSAAAPWSRGSPATSTRSASSWSSAGCCSSSASGRCCVATVVMAGLQLAARPSSSGSASLPLFLSLRYFQRKLSAAYSVVRRQVGAMLSAISEPVVGAAVVRSYAVEDRTQAPDRRRDRRHQQAASTRAQSLTVVSFSLGGHLGRPGQRRRASSSASGSGFAGELTAGRSSPSPSWSRSSSGRCRWAPRSSPTPRTPSRAGAG